VELLVLGLVLVGGYFVSLRLNPWVKCSKCHGQPKKQGSFFGYAHHPCDKCDGKGQQVRFGRKLFNMGPGRP
jgi:DnaJ-class molecular chaperone